ncbi:hypothetical protein BC939DRAFT_176768 [Gamsiella multidivaricata]|uniref:uncharacterized protein n=1 Tax=Gamsiella multidivaricata TaxID=101098 RepID=UPI00221EBBF5|nr:uncharacterized protein BC939DRAFT_176768 [Gamsiella multidivaricata]KAI7822674.1 hypothetical protein BC939DRAFT_176768 [Gamsiella multidivaricata]
MSFPKDSKRTQPDIALPEDEQLTFGRQAPYATSSATSHPETEAEPLLSEPFAASQPPSNRRTPQEFAPQDIPPPTYEDVVRPRMPQGTYGPSPSNEPDSPRASSDPNFSTPLLGQAPATPYTTIPVPPVQPTSQRESSSEASSKWSRFWLVFFFVIVVLSVIDDNTTTVCIQET